MKSRTPNPHAEALRQPSSSPTPRGLATAAVAVAAAALIGGGTATYSGPAAAQGAQSVEEIVVTGSRGRPRTVQDSPVPVDVFSAAELESVSYVDTNDILQTLVPSYNVSRSPISDGQTFIRTPSLRGLPTDKTLVLINSKRRHRSALVLIGGFGTQGPDVATIPATALANVEVLRDGASAQYGSDAIAGVINFLLKDDADGGSFRVHSGQYSEGDGASFTVEGNIGLPLGDSGFINLSAQIHESDATERGIQYCTGRFCVDPNDERYGMGSSAFAHLAEDADYQANLHLANIGFGDFVQPWGQPDREANSFFVNAGYELDADSELYGYANSHTSETNGSFFYRWPGNGTIEYLREADGSLYWPLEKHPGGFTPRFFGDITDFSFVGGYRGVWGNGINYDFSYRIGENEIAYTLKNTINPSLGPDSPTSFKPGDLVNTESAFQADFTYETPRGVLWAFGAVLLDESYEVVEGEELSYRAGPYAQPDPHNLCPDEGEMGYVEPMEVTRTVVGRDADRQLNCADEDDPVYTVVGVGSNGFPGFSPQFSEEYDRGSFALYGDVSANITESFFVQGALRYEDYDDFDTELSYKLAGRYLVNDRVGLRGSIGTGFRAPTPGQQGTINVSTRLPAGVPVATGLFPAHSAVAQALGATALKPETSTNYTLGLTATWGIVDLTVDYYRVDIDDRTRAISTRNVSTDPNSGDAYDNYIALRDAGVVGAETIGGVNYFTNAFDSSTVGWDIVATFPVTWARGETVFTASLNNNEEEFESDPTGILNAEDQFDFENFDSNWRSVISARHTAGDWTFFLRHSWYGESENSQSSDSAPGGLIFQTIDSITFTDLEGSYRFNDRLSLTAGGRNIFDNYPSKDSIGDYCCGRIYSSATDLDWQGAYYYARLNYDF